MKNKYIKSPSEKLTENQIDVAQATLNSESNGLVQALNMLGGLSQQVGGVTMGKGMSAGETGFLADNGKDFLSLLNTVSPLLNKFAYGGQVGNVNIEAEGDEVGEDPNGRIIKFKGKKHEKGGIKTSVPTGTHIFSDRIEVDGETLAKRKLNREKKEKKFNGTDAIAKNSLKRSTQANSLQEEEDLKLQELVKLLGPKALQRLQSSKKFAFGGVAGMEELESFLIPMLTQDYFTGNTPNLNTINTGATNNETNNSLVDTKSNSGVLKDLIPNITMGDGIGMAGNIFQALSAYQNTLNNRATDTLNINTFQDFGKDALNTNQEAMGITSQLRDKQLRDLELNRSSLSTANRQGARSINTMRALDLSGSIASNQSESDINNAYASQLLSLLQGKSQLQNQRDQAVMGGDYQKDLADRQDKDAFYTNKGQNLTDLGKATSLTGKALNDMQSRDTQAELMNQLFDYIGFDPMTGKVNQKKNVKLTK